jgi:hypothetical protein
MINKYENSSVGVYWDDVGVPESCRVSEQEGNNVLKIVKSTVKVHLVWHSIHTGTETGRQMWAVVYYSMRLRKTNCENSEGPTL